MNVRVEICIGSSCHLRGSRAVIAVFDKLIKAHHLERKVELCGSFCIGACTKGVSVRIEKQAIYHVIPADAEAFFEEVILRRLTEDESN